MTEIETWQDNTRNGMARYQQPPPSAQPANVVALMDWAQSARAAHEVAQSLVQSSFVPAAFRGKPHEATAAILSGLEVGLNPMAALRAFDVIQGTAAPKAITLRAIVQSRGHEVWVHESTATRAIVKGRRAGTDRIQESVWDIDRARGLGLLQKDNWKKQAGAMLVARGTSEVCRLIASDAILGLPYTSEELADGAADDYEPIGTQQVDTPSAAQPPQPARRTAQRRTQPHGTPTPARTPEPAQAETTGPPLPGEDDYDDPDNTTPAEPGITKAQLTKLHTVFSKGGIQDRETRLQACCLIVAREMDHSTDLTKAEATRLIDQLEQWLNEGVLAETVAELVEQPQDGTP